MPQIGPLTTGNGPALGLSTLLPLGEQDPENLEEQLIAHSAFKVLRHGNALTAVATLLGVLAVPAMSTSFLHQAPFVICSWVWGLSSLSALFHFWLRTARGPPAILEDHECLGPSCPASTCSVASALPVLAGPPQESSPTSDSELLMSSGLHDMERQPPQSSPSCIASNGKVTICDRVEEQTIPRVTKFAELTLTHAEEASRKRALLAMFREDSAVSLVPIAQEATSPRCEASQHSRLLSSPQRSQSFPMYSRESSRDMDGGYYQSRTNSRHLREDSNSGHSKPVRSGADPLRELEGMGSMRQTNGASTPHVALGLVAQSSKENEGATAAGNTDSPSASRSSASSTSIQKKVHQDPDLATVWDEFDEEDPKISEVTIPSPPKMLLAREPSDIIRQQQRRTCQGYYEPPRRLLDGADDAEEETPFVSRPKHSVLSFVGAYAVLGFFFVVFCSVAGFEIAALLRPLPDRMPLTTVDSRHSPPHWPKTSLDMNESTVSKPFWVAGPWGHCSTGCGVGKMHREVRCAFGSHQNCIDQFGDPPEYVRTCREYMGCQWNAGPWGQCNATCGFGVQRREVLCTNSQIADCFVPRELWLVPNDTRECVKTDDCLWKIGDWGDCSTTCGVGERRREATCTNGDAKFCQVHGSQPNTAEACETYDKCRWNTSAWSVCSSRCGRGTRTRTVACPSENETFCFDQDGPLPSQEEACHDLTSCRWTTTSWSSCTGRCGPGTQERNVSCATGKEEDCTAHEPRPSQLKSCVDSEACEWTNSWSTCSSSCGSGHRLRNASCSPMSHQRPLDCGDKHGGLKSVLFVDPCHNVSGCRWVTSDWGNCSASCGQGIQLREVVCSVGNDKDCAEHEAAPSSSQNCTGTQACPRSKDHTPSREGNLLTFTVAGVFHAGAGWMLTFVSLHEFAHQGAGREYSSNWGTLLAPYLILVTGLGGLAGVLVLSHALLPGSEQVQKAALAGGHFAIGFLCVSMGAASLRQVSPYTGFREMLACAKKWQVRWLTSGFLLVVFCVGVLAVAVKQTIS